MTSHRSMSVIDNAGPFGRLVERIARKIKRSTFLDHIWSIQNGLDFSGLLTFGLVTGSLVECAHQWVKAKIGIFNKRMADL